MLPVGLSSAMSSSLSPRFCFNSECFEFRLEHNRPGWRLRTGDFADLCDRCASVYEQGKFCDIFHIKASGWRCCDSCGKRIHCGCIVSASSFMLLDAGGVECLVCARKKVALGSNFSQSPSFLFQSPISEKFKDLSINWSSPTGSNQISYQPSSLLGPSVLQFNRGGTYEFNQPISKDRATACPMEKEKGMNLFMGKLMNENSKNYKVSPCPNVNVYHPLMPLKEGTCGTQHDFPVPITTLTERTGHFRQYESNLWHTPNASPPSHLHNSLNGGAESLFESKSQNLRTHLDTPGKYQVVPRYWPKISNKNQILQNQSNEYPSCLIETTLEYNIMLSASDTGKVGRLVLPKKCAEAFFPRISNTEGVPLKVQDSMGKEWTFQFRFWPNNRSRMYVLEGVTPCIQSMQLQAGDTELILRELKSIFLSVIFSQLDPERKLIMGFRKASVAQSSDQETDPTNNNHENCTDGEAETADMDSLYIVNTSTYLAKETPGVSSGKKKSNMMMTRSKRQKVEKGDHIELMLTWEEAQRFLLPPPNVTPSRVVIEEHEFEEYEDAPVIGKPTNDTGSTCTADQGVVLEQEDEVIEEVDELSMSAKTTTKHPRHRSGCTCIICIQSPSGQGPKHNRGCSCAVCNTVKRRRRTLLLRREKKKLEKEKNAHKELEQLNSDDDELHQSGNYSKNHKPLKIQIDLNIQPEKDEESQLPDCNTPTKNKSLHHDDTVKSSSSKPPCSTGASSQIDKEDEGKLTDVADTTTTSSS
uniref:Putative B3 domain-containing transcription factor VAL3 n=1 Tax=Leavenworthia alabamica TaxID=310722 RepID=R9S9T6_LEAAL|nr:putative B3 domain-containing transcription factor VAL3 [Leavenworthia alabamica]